MTQKAINGRAGSHLYEFFTSYCGIYYLRKSDSQRWKNCRHSEYYWQIFEKMTLLKTESAEHLIRNFGISTTAGGGVLGRLCSSTPSPSPTRRSRVGLGLGRGVLELKLHEVPTTDSSQVR